MLSALDSTTQKPLAHKGKMDILEGAMARMPQIHCPLEHRFTTGIYSRTIFMPAGTVITSRTHKVQHPFVITKGVCDVYDEEGNTVRLSAGHIGITEPGTRRVLLIHEDTIWTIFIPTDKTDPVEIAEEISESENPCIPEGFRQGYLGSRGDLTWR